MKCFALILVASLAVATTTFAAPFRSPSHYASNDIPEQEEYCAKEREFLADADALQLKYKNLQSHTTDKLTKIRVRINADNLALTREWIRDLLKQCTITNSPKK